MEIIAVGSKGNDYWVQFSDEPQIKVTENKTLVHKISSNLENGEFENINISSAGDGAFFEIIEANNSTALYFKTSPDFENPLDSDSDNIYEVELMASDGGQETSRKLSVKIENIDEAPSALIISTLNLKENQQSAGSVSASDPDGDTLTYSITGGADAFKFTISANTGELSFLEIPDYENPSDNNADNVFEINVSATDGKATITKDFSITVTDVYEPSRPNHFVESAANLEMIWVEPGTFTMGSPETEPVREFTKLSTKSFSQKDFTWVNLRLPAQYEAVMTGNPCGLSATPSY